MLQEIVMTTMSICKHHSVSSLYNYSQMIEHSLSMCNCGDEEPESSKKHFHFLCGHLSSIMDTYFSLVLLWTGYDNDSK